jgi:hypothetical protein
VENTVKLADDVYYDVNTQNFIFPNGGGYALDGLSAGINASNDDLTIFRGNISFSDMITGGQVVPAPYWAGSPAGFREEMPTETNIKALMYENDQGYVEHWINDPSQDNSSLGDDIIITYSFVENSTSKVTDDYGSTNGPNQPDVWTMNDAQRVSVRESLDAWSDVADITFVEIDETASDSVVGTMRFGFTTYKGDAQNVGGWATGPGGQTSCGDVWIATTDDDDGAANRAKDNLFEKGYSQDYLTLLHEIGHALGLAHPFDGYLMEGADPATGEGAPLDNQKYTVMSYSVDDEVWFNGPGHPDMGYAISYTPMMEDIAAIQWMYGAQETNEDDTVYGSDYFNPEKPFSMAIWDSGGVDTIDLSAFTEGNTLNLVSGTSSTVVCEMGGTGWAIGQMQNNLSIAHGTTIENLIAGSGDDHIEGNTASNTLTGGDGADTFVFTGDFGADIITDFIVGTDLLMFNGGTIGTAEITESVSGSDLVLTVSVGNTVTLTGLGSETFDDGFLV